MIETVVRWVTVKGFALSVWFSTIHLAGMLDLMVITPELDQLITWLVGTMASLFALWGVYWKIRKDPVNRYWDQVDKKALTSDSWMERALLAESKLEISTKENERLTLEIQRVVTERNDAVRALYQIERQPELAPEIIDTFLFAHLTSTDTKPVEPNPKGLEELSSELELDRDSDPKQLESEHASDGGGG